MGLEVVKVTDEEKELLTVDDVAAKLGVSPRSVRRWFRQGKLRGIRAGKRWLVSPASLEAFLHGGNERQLIINIDIGVGSLSIEDQRTGNLLTMPDDFWKDFAGMLSKRGWREVAHMIHQALEKFQRYRDSLLTQEPERLFVLCHSLDEVAYIAGGDQPNRYGPCPICQDETCEWEIVDAYELDKLGYTAQGAPGIYINNRSGNENLGVLVDGEWSEEVLKARKAASK